MKIKLIDFGYKNPPKRAHYNDAGADVYACIKTQSKIRVWPNDSMKIPLGFGVEIPDGYTGFICPRSGLSSKGISCEMSPIDSGYRGEVHAIVTNNTTHDFWINDGDRIGQLVIVPVVLADFVKPSEMNDARGDGAFGSTGT